MAIKSLFSGRSSVTLLQPYGLVSCFLYWQLILVTFNNHNLFLTLKGKSGDILYFYYRQQIPCAEPNQQWMYPTKNYCVCVSKAWYKLFLCAIELHCCPKTIKNTIMRAHSHWVTCCFIIMKTQFILNPTHTVLLPWILTRGPNVD